ncbi:family 78 glycoside hydrolase catalytic domain [Cryptosporangium aurantiacum]|uniref:alpha-L-rhamnosidase n=1 Tax=Cryptosporangium aurantiacum TaxID=134849 RepID=A0A1M7RFD1_9ACTN|nr:family 78 glycoside hydrolase catalytic domain [Cryptosporangium aurantiacum]SHN44944.1 beta-glucosidase [Cryptosporangium aurantiacum]
MHAYQDPGISVAARVQDLLGRMTIEEKAGLLFHAMAMPGPGGVLLEPGQAGGLPVDRTGEQISAGLSHFNVLGEATPRAIAVWHNTLQTRALDTRLGIPVTLSSDPRHGFVANLATSAAAGGFSQWPEPLGLAATGDAALVRRHAEVVRRELVAVGIRVLLGPSADLASDPRWARMLGTFGANADLVGELTVAYLEGLRGDIFGPDSVAAMVKHFPGAGPQKDGEDAHFPYGREQVYPGGRFDLHLAPFERAIAAGVTQVMPYYGMPVGLDDVEEVGFSFNRGIVTGLLREKLGFDGIVCTDWGLVTDGEIFGAPMPARAWGVEHLDRHERIARILDAGCDQLGGEAAPELVVDLVAQGRLAESRLDVSVRRLLAEKFRLGLFDDRRFVDVDAVDDLVGTPAARAEGLEAQRRSIVVLTGETLRSDQTVYVEGADAEIVAEYATVTTDPNAADVAIVRIDAPFEPRTAGFENFFHAGSLEFPADVEHRLLDLAARVPVQLCVFLDRPAVLTPLARTVAGLAADFGASDEALLDVLFGRTAPGGRLPVELPSSMQDVRRQREDVPSDAIDPLFARGAGQIWQARFIRPAQPPTAGIDGPAIAFRGRFTVHRASLVAAWLHVTAHGVYEPYLNGTRIGDDVLAPGWSSYPHRLRYATHDVLPLLADGQNVLGALVADGWYRGRVGFDGGKRDVYGDTVGLFAQLEFIDADGTRTVVGTGPDWEYGPSPITRTGLYDGEHHDARIPLHWTGGDWQPVTTDPAPPRNLVTPDGPPVRRIQELAPVAVRGSIYDFGQNLVGRVRLTVTGPAGATVTLRHAEVLDNGDLGIRPLRQAAQTDTYVLAGDGTEVWEPRFTLHGFRYVQVDGDLTPDALTAIVVHSDMPRTGWFDCSDPDVSRLHENVVWSMRGNFVDLPTDCPQRDERLGWTGDIQLFAPTATYLYDCTGLLRSWLRDLAAEQYPDGNVPLFVPTLNYDRWPPQFMAAWGDAAVVVPWTLYQATGDDQVLRDQLPSMRAWVDGVENLCGPTLTWPEGMQLGDWLEPASPPDAPWQSSTDYRLVGTASFAHCADLLSQIHDALGLPSRYGALAEEIKTAVRDAYVTPDGLLTSDSQTAYALAIGFGLLDGPDRQRAGDRLAELVRKNEYAIGTGFVGTPLVCAALTETGHVDDAYRMLLRRDCPSWLYPVTMGATTVWERWDSLLPDGRINPGEMTSFNHYALGAIADWLHRTVAGLAPAAPGWSRLLIRPQPPAGGELTWASARHLTPHGPAEVRWDLDQTTLRVDVLVPDGVSARLELPGAEPEEVGPGRHHRLAPFTVGA